MSHYRRALALDPELAGAHNNLANALVAQARSEEALVHFRRALALEELGDTDQARADYRRALELQPDFADARRRLNQLDAPAAR